MAASEKLIEEVIRFLAEMDRKELNVSVDTMMERINFHARSLRTIMTTYYGPEFSDGCDHEGFKGGCQRQGHSPESHVELIGTVERESTGFGQVSTTIRFSVPVHEIPVGTRIYASAPVVGCLTRAREEIRETNKTGYDADTLRIYKEDQ